MDAVIYAHAFSHIIGKKMIEAAWSRAPQTVEHPEVNLFTAKFRKQRTENGQQATQAGRDCLEVTAG